MDDCGLPILASGGLVLEQIDELVGQRQTGFGVLGAVQDRLQRSQLLSGNCGGVDFHAGGGLVAGNIDRGRGELPAELNGVRGVIDGVVGTLRGRGLGTIDQMRL